MGTIQEQAHGPNAERNRYVHDARFVEVGSGQAAQLKSYRRDQLTFGIVDVDETKLTALVAEIKELAASANELRGLIFAELHPQ